MSSPFYHFFKKILKNVNLIPIICLKVGIMNIYKQLRKNKNLTQDEFSKILNVDRSTISKWEQDKAIPDIKMLSTLANFFNVSIDYLLGKTNTYDPPKTNTIVVFGRGTGREEYHMSDEQIKLLKSLIENMKDSPDVDKF